MIGQVRGKNLPVMFQVIGDTPPVGARTEKTMQDNQWWPAAGDVKAK